jgi:hypothetical protein
MEGKRMERRNEGIITGAFDDAVFFLISFFARANLSV